MGKRIHIIDDDPFMKHLLRKGLEKQGFTVTFSPDAYKIFDLAENSADLFLLDVIMPGLNGLETCKWLKSQNPNIKVIVSSGTPGLKVLSENACADGYIEKPFTVALLVEKINATLSAEATEA